MDLNQELSLLSPLWTGELDPSLLARLKGHETLGPALSGHYGDLSDSDLLDHLAADHYSLFGLEVFPYASVFFNENAHMGGEVSGYVGDLFRLRGLEAPSEPDHLGQEFRLLANLIEAGDETALGSFFWVQLMSWYFPFAEALRALDHPFFNQVLSFQEGLLANLASQLEPIPPEIPAPDAQPLEALDQEETGLKDISEFLLAPRLSGFYMGRTALAALGEAVDMPVGFGTRSTLLPQLFYTAVDYERMPAILGALLQIVEAHQTRYGSIKDRWPGSLDYWISRLDVIHQMLSKMKASL